MAAVTTNGDAAANALDDIKPPAGVVLPPREIRNVLEKTAGYVARNGAVFEDRIREKERSNPKFSFLNPSDAYHPFYQWRLDEVKSGRGTAIAAGRVGEPAAEAPKPQGPPKPADYLFSARTPRINRKDLDVIQLSALFVAKNGRQFMTQLAQREAGNPQFGFLIPNHTLHNFFQHIIDQTQLYYVQAASAETITFNEADEHANLPPPTNLSDLQYASLEDRNNASISASLRIEEAMPDEDTTYNAYPNQPAPYPIAPQQPAYQPAQMPPPVQPYSPVPQAQPQQPQRSAQEEEEERRIQERAEQQARKQQATAEARGGAPPMKIKENYVPRAAQKAANRQGAQTALCPNCKQQIPMNELEAHMRIELLDPRWKEQKAKADTRYASSNTIHVDVANNLKRLASQRSDVFDPVTGQAISEDELARRKKAAIHSYDGAMDAKSQAQLGHMQNVNVEDQIRAIHQKFADKR
ncbi:hypothetical protein FVEG_02540 [Fusarium verticillioides 7600]|uniref:SURP motif domain-containing protein n=1 Tax=Gibberella moniliformis (strain M3125 / FGSC 7600) TaxID=334819 RepID=W7LWR1_GIBM7|nr:hypothetical protein FVEG_02540 [Fusarium verticillioides 7600]EWG39910.1 hypothetical protein FVEG_02540 [Fusarium verticillioides 7600]